MRIRRVIPPAAAPVDLKSLFCGLIGTVYGTGYLKRLENEIKEYFKVKHVFLVSSGKAALAITLRALKTLTPGKDEVIIPAYTCYSVPSAIMRAGLKISPCDIDPSSLDFDYDQLEKTINDNTLCVVPTHLFGIPADMDTISSICRERSVFIVEDAAQAMGGTYKNKRLGTIGDVGLFSLGRGKNVTCGAGGIIITNSERIAYVIREASGSLMKPSLIGSIIEFLRVATQNILINPYLYWLPSGLPFLKLGETIFNKDFPEMGFSGMKAGLMRNWRKRLEKSNSIRKKNGEQLGKLLGLDRGKKESFPLLRLPVITKNNEERDIMYALSRFYGTGFSKMYPAPVHKIEEIMEQFTGKRFPVAEAISGRVLTVPTHELLSKKDGEKIQHIFQAARRRPSSDLPYLASRKNGDCHV